MKRNHNLRICLTVAVILFFIGVVFAPSVNINVVKGYNENDLVQVTTRTCDLKEDNICTVLLTKRQVQEVQRKFDELKNRVSTSKSLEETQQIFNDTIASLSSFNLFPQNMNIVQAKRLVSIINQNQKILLLLQKISTKFKADTKAGVIQNSFCLVAGNTSNTHFVKPVTKLTMHIFDIMDYSSENIILLRLSTILWIILNPLSIISQMILKLQGNHCGISIFFGNFHYYPYPNWLFPAQGWISTDGINGKQNISGSFWGQKMTSGWQPQDDWYMNYTWRGCMGFTGFITYIGSDSAYYIGSAIDVNVGSNRP